MIPYDVDTTGMIFGIILFVGIITLIVADRIDL